MTQLPQSPAVQPAETNGLGLAGFICSLLGIFTGGLLCPIGLILSLIAIGRQPRGFAIAGLVIGLLGSCGGVIVFILAGTMIMAMIMAMLGLAAAVAFAALSQPQQAEVTVDMALIAATVESQRDDTGYLPAGLENLNLDTESLTDPWGNPYRYMLRDDLSAGYELTSTGPDGQMGNADDLQFSNLDEYWSNIELEATGDDDRGIVQISVGGKTIEIRAENESGHVEIDLGDRVIEITGDDEGGAVRVRPAAEVSDPADTTSADSTDEDASQSSSSPPEEE